MRKELFTEKEMWYKYRKRIEGFVWEKDKRRDENEKENNCSYDKLDADEHP